MIYFICSNDYQIMRAVAYAAVFNKKLCIFNLSNKQYKSIDDVKVLNPDREVLFDFKNTIDNTNISNDTLIFIRILFNLDKELHAFQYAEYLFDFGRDNIILHEQGDSSYVLNDYYLYGEANPDTLQYFITQQPIDDNRNVLWDFYDTIKLEWVKKKISKIFDINLNVLKKQDVSNTVLFVHNEPDSKKYNKDQKLVIYKDIIQLLHKIKNKGYNLWVKTHHKRNSAIDFSKLADKVIERIPLEIIPNLHKFKYVISVRNSGIENLNYENCINGLTKEAITKCKKNWPYVYSRGIQKIKKKLDLK